MARLRNELFDEVQKWANADNIIDVFSSPSQSLQSLGANHSAPLQNDNVEMGSEGINADIIELKREYVEKYGSLTTEEAKLVIKAIFPRSMAKRMLEPETYNVKQLEFALDVGATALVIDEGSGAIQLFYRFNPYKAVKAALDLWDVPDAEDYKDELEDGFDDLSSISHGILPRYTNLAMGIASVDQYFLDLK